MIRKISIPKFHHKSDEYKQYAFAAGQKLVQINNVFIRFHLSSDAF